jgi:mRNA interferase YafQ
MSHEPAWELFPSPFFLRALKKHIGRDKKRLVCMFETLLQLALDPWHPTLSTHQLRGGGKGFLSCSCGYDCRIIFRIVSGASAATDCIELINVGTHDEVY